MGLVFIVNRNGRMVHKKRFAVIRKAQVHMKRRPNGYRVVSRASVWGV